MHADMERTITSPQSTLRPYPCSYLSHWGLNQHRVLILLFLSLQVFVLIGSTSALTTSMAGILKDWICIASSVVVFQTEVTQMQVVGYGVALCGVVYYQRQKFFKK